MRYAPSQRSRRAASNEAKTRDTRQASLSLRVDFGAHGFLGPGKVRLMELIAEHGSISAAGKTMGMSYRRAWLLVDEINKIFRSPLVEKQMGGTGGGGAVLTKFGQDVVQRFRAIERETAAAVVSHLNAFKTALAPRPAGREE